MKKMRKIWDVFLTKPKVKLVKTNKYIFVNFNGNNFLISQPVSLVLILSNGIYNISEIVEKMAYVYDEDESKVYELVNNIYKNYQYLFVHLPQKLKRPVNLVHDPNRFKFIPNDDEIINFENLLQVGIVLSEKCPLKCKYCYAFKNSHKVGFNFIDFKLVEKFLKEASELGAKELNIGGGDPLRYPNLYDLIKKAIEFKFKEIYLSTKPSRYYDRYFFSNLFISGLREIQFSLDAINPNIIKKIVPYKEFYEKSIYSMYNAIAEGLDVVVKVVVLKDNSLDVIPLVEFLDQIGVREINLSVVMPIGMAKFEMLPSHEEIDNLYEKIEELKDKIGAKLTFSKGIFYNSNLTFCSAYKTSCFLYPDGNIEPCDFMGSFRKEINFSIGNIKYQNLTELWDKENEIFKYFRQPPANDVCKKCNFRNMCLGGCKALSYMVFGDITHPFNYCQLGNKILKTFLSKGGSDGKGVLSKIHFEQV